MAPPSYDWDNQLSPYQNQSNTGIARQLQQQHKEMLAASRAHALERMRRDLQDIRYHIDDIDHKMYMTGTSRTNPYSTYVIETPEPSVETVEFKAPQWWTNLWADPFWEFFKRPKIHV